MALNLPQFYCYGLLFFHQYAIVFVFLQIHTYRDVTKNSKMRAHISNSIHSHAICQEKMFFAFNFISYSFGDERMGRSLLVMGRVIKSHVLGFRGFAFLLIFQREKLATDNHILPLLSFTSFSLTLY